MDQLQGGRDGISKSGNIISRPSNLWTKDVQGFLGYLNEMNFNKVPKPITYNEQSEQVSYVEGQVHNDLLPMYMKSDQALISFVRLVKQYHQISQGYIHRLSGNEHWMLPIKEPVEVMCHGDLAPYNVTEVDGDIVGIIDFDTCHPGPVLWDLAYGAYRFVPLMAPENPESFGTKLEQVRRLKLLIETYDLECHINNMLEYAVRRLEALIDYMEKEALLGNENVLSHIEEGHISSYKRDITYIKTLMMAT